jgi:L-aminopeptidase/D-esterase-like protein
MGHLTDVEGIRVGNHHRRGPGWRTGTTVVLAPPGTTAGVDVRGGGPGTRETDLLRPENLVNEVHAVVLTGGSAYGLAAADGVMAHLADRGVGFPVGDEPGWVVPIVPAAVIFDLGRGGHFDHRPDPGFGRRAAAAATPRPEQQGTVGAGTGAVAGGLQGGVGSASTVTPSGIRVAALAVVNSSGSVIDPATGLPWEATGMDLRRPTVPDRRALRTHLGLIAGRAAAPANTTIGVVATDAALTKAECTRVATVAHDGLARAVRPAHSLRDGDTIFALATGRQMLPDTTTVFGSATGRVPTINEILVAAAEVFALACSRALVEATSHPGGPPAYLDLVPSAARARDR